MIYFYKCHYKANAIQKKLLNHSLKIVIKQSPAVSIAKTDKTFLAKTSSGLRSREAMLFSAHNIKVKRRATAAC